MSGKFVTPIKLFREHFKVANFDGDKGMIEV
jgi:hypothetical protein